LFFFNPLRLNLLLYLDDLTNKFLLGWQSIPNIVFEAQKKFVPKKRANAKASSFNVLTMTDKNIKDNLVKYKIVDFVKRAG